MESSLVRSHQNKRRKLDEYLQNGGDISFREFVRQIPHQDLPIFAQLKKVKKNSFLDEFNKENQGTRNNPSSISNSMSICLSKSPGWKKEPKVFETTEAIYKEINTFLKSLRQEQRNRKRRLIHERERSLRGEMIIEGEQNELEVEDEEEENEPDPENEMVIESDEYRKIQESVEEYYEEENTLLYELWLMRNNRIQEE